MKLFPNGLDLSDIDQIALEHDIVDIECWVKEAIIGKIHNCKTRMFREWQSKLLADPKVSSIPADETALIYMIKGRPDYQNRFQREEAERKRLEALENERQQAELLSRGKK